MERFILSRYCVFKRGNNNNNNNNNNKLYETESLLMTTVRVKIFPLLLTPHLV